MKGFVKILSFCLVTSLVFFLHSTAGFAEQSVLKEGMCGDSVLQLQQRLLDLGYYQGVPDGAFGPATRSAVESYQSANNFTIDGIAGYGTLSALSLLGSGTAYESSSQSAAPSVIKEGMYGDSVLQLQQKLINLGYYQGTPDGSFGPGTLSAVISFQSANNLYADGIAGSATLAALNLAAAANVNTPTSGSESESALKQGMSGDSVLKLQTRLSALGYYQGALDGSFGSGTRIALTNFQYDNKLTVDGIAGEQTMLALQFANAKVSFANRGQNLNRKGQLIIEFARNYLGVPYVWAGQGPSGFDCSGFVYYVFKNFNIALPRAADEQFYAGSGVSSLQPGDLVFFTTYLSGPSHVGIYIGDNIFIHASSGTGDVTITSLSDSYYRARYLGARRYLG